MTVFVLALVIVASASLGAQVSFDRLLRLQSEPQNWLTYSGNLQGHRHSLLTQVTPNNVKNLELAWAFQALSLEKFEATPIALDGVLYTVQPPNDVIAIDGASGRTFWTYTYRASPQARPCCGRVNRGLAILGESLFMGTIDGRFVALDAKSGRELWNVTVAGARAEAGYTFTVAPLVVKDTIIAGPAGGDFGVRGFIAAFDPKTGKELWRFNTIPGPGEKGHDTRAGESWKTGGSAIWTTGSGKPFAKVTWTTGLDEKGRPQNVVKTTAEGNRVYPHLAGATNWYSPSYSPRTGLFYVPSWQDGSAIFANRPAEYVEGRSFLGTFPVGTELSINGTQSNRRLPSGGHGAVLALDPTTGEKKWEFTMSDVTDAGILTTSSDLLFSGGREGFFYALDARTGQLLWKAPVAGIVQAAPMSYGINGRQYVAIAAGNTLYAYTLRQQVRSSQTMHSCRSGRRRRCTPEIGFRSDPIAARRVIAASRQHPLHGSKRLRCFGATRTRGRNSPRKARSTRFPAAR